MYNKQKKSSFNESKLIEWKKSTPQTTHLQPYQLKNQMLKPLHFC